MVRVNLIEPKALSDQHLIAEYNEILMLIAYIKTYPMLDNIPKNYTLGKGHMRFFKDKILYLKRRHDAIRGEMMDRGFRANRIILLEYRREMLNDWRPDEKDLRIIKSRLIEKLRSKDNYYRYYRAIVDKEMLIELVRTAKGL